MPQADLLKRWFRPQSRKRRFAGLLALVLLACGGLFLGLHREHGRLLEQLETSPQAEERARALTRLAQLRRDEDLPVILRAARDVSPLVRRAAALGLGRTRHARAVDPLGELLGDSDPAVQAEAAAALALFNANDKARAYLLNGYSRYDGPARKAIAAVIGPTGLADAVRHEAKMIWERAVRVLDAGGLAERVGAVEELGRSGRGDAVERLLPLLGDSTLLAAGAARGLGAARDPRALAPLMATLDESQPVLREAAAEALGALGDPAAVDALARMGARGGPGALAAVRALGMLGDSAEARRALCGLVSEGPAELALAAARVMRERGGCPTERIVARLARGPREALAGLAALQGLGGSAGAEKVTTLLEAYDPEVRVAAAIALAEMEAPMAGPRLLKLLQAEVARRAELRERLGADAAPPTPAAENALEQGRAGSIEQMLTRVKAREGVQARLAALSPSERARSLEAGAKEQTAWLCALIAASGRQRVDDAHDLLVALASDPSEAVRAAACGAVFALGTPEAMAAGRRCLQDSAPMVVAWTARGMRLAGAPAAPVLRAALESRGGLRGEIIRALGELRAREARPVLEAVLDEGGPDSVDAAVALGRIGDPAAVPALSRQLADATCPARLEIVEALGAIGDAAGAEAVRQELSSERPEVRAAAARALARMGYRDRSGALDALRFDYYLEVRRAAEEALGKPTAR